MTRRASRGSRDVIPRSGKTYFATFDRMSRNSRVSIAPSSRVLSVSRTARNLLIWLTDLISGDIICVFSGAAVKCNVDCSCFCLRVSFESIVSVGKTGWFDFWFSHTELCRNPVPSFVQLVLHRLVCQNWHVDTDPGSTHTQFPGVELVPRGVRCR